jgi:hypothetical protein
MRNIVIALLAFLAVPAWAVTVTVDGQRLAAQPILSGGRVLVPLRAVFQALNAHVDYRNSTITATRDGQTVQLRPNQSVATVNGTRVNLDAPARLVRGTTYVPLRFVAQALGEDVAWQSASKNVAIGVAPIANAPLPSGRVDNVALAPKLNRLVVGNQGGVLKVRDASATSVVYYRGLDDRSVAPLSDQDQREILGALNLAGNPDDVSRQLMSQYPTLSKKKEALALLGVLNSLPSRRLASGPQIRAFLANRMQHDSSVHNRRQATLALAVGSAIEASTVAAVVNHYQSSENLWETFPVQQFFEYQAVRIRQMPNYSSVRNEVLSVNSLYRENIAGFLGS